MMDTASGGTRQIIYEFARATVLEGWWIWALLLGCLAMLFVGCVRFYRRDTAELSGGVRWTLIFLRLVAIVALVFFFFDLQRRTQRLVTRPSEVAILVDTSQSMSLPAGATSAQQSRSERVAALLKESNLLDKLSDEHRVSVYAFDDDSEARLLETRGGVEVADEEASETTAQAPQLSLPAVCGAIMLALAALLGLASLFLGAAGRTGSLGWLLISTATLLVAGTITLGGSYMVRTEHTLAQILGIEVGPGDVEETEPDEAASTDEPIRVQSWDDEIAAAGSESRIGDAIRAILTDHDPATLAGIVLLTDGQSNGGIASTVAMTSARRSEVAVFPVGLGSSDAPANVRVVDLDAPAAFYPGDKFTVTGVLQASGPKDIEVDVQLLDALDVDATNRARMATVPTAGHGPQVLPAK